MSKTEIKYPGRFEEKLEIQWKCMTKMEEPGPDLSHKTTAFKSKSTVSLLSQQQKIKK